MKQLESFLQNPFSDPKISLDKKKKFGESHLVNLTVQNTANIYDQTIVDTAAVQTALFGDITNVEVTKALQKAQTESVDHLMEAFKKRNTRLNNFLISTEVDKQPVYQTFFPQGVTEFTRDVNKGNVEQLMTRLVEVITLQPAVAGGATVLAEYEAFRIQYALVRNLQLTKISQVSAGITNRENAEAAWDNQLFDNLLLIARENKGQPDLINNFFDQSIVHTPNNTQSKDIMPLV